MPKKPKATIDLESGKGVVTDSAKIDKKKIEEAAQEMRLSFDPHLITERIIKFGTVLTGIPIYRYQYDIIYRIVYSIITLEGAVITVIISRQAGKSEAMAFIIDTIAVILPVIAKFIPELDQYKDGVKIGLFAPQSDQMQSTYSRALQRITTEKAELILDDPEIQAGLVSSVKFSLTNGSFMKGQLIHKLSKIESATYDVAIIEEAQDTDDYITEKSVVPMLSATNGTLVKIGTTGTHRGHYYESIQENIREDRKIKDERLKLHYEYNYKEVIRQKREQYDIDGKKFHLNYEKFVQELVRRKGLNYEPFRLSYALEWALESGMFLTHEAWNKIQNKRLGLKEYAEDGKLYVAGLDIGKAKASTVLTIVEVIDNPDELNPVPIKQIVFWLELIGEDYELQHLHIVEALIDWNVQVLTADYTGVGKPVVDRLMAELSDFINIVPYTFSRPSKSDMWQALDADIRAGRLIVPAHKNAKATQEFQHFEAQMHGLTKEWVGSYLVCQKGTHEDAADDYCDSLGLACLSASEPIPEEAEDFEENTIFSHTLTKRKLINANKR